LELKLTNGKPGKKGRYESIVASQRNLYTRNKHLVANSACPVGVLVGINPRDDAPDKVEPPAR
jgi:hypothetical protein